MNSFKIIVIAVSIAFSFVIGISQSQADFEIEEMYPSYGGYYDYSGFLYNTAYVKTSEPYLVVDWYIKEKDAEEYEYGGYSTGDNEKTEASFSPYSTDYPGSPFGIAYTIKAVAYSLYDEDEKKHHSDTDSYDVTVYTPLITDSYFGGHNTAAEMEVWVDVGWNGMTAEIVVGGYVKNWELDKTITYGFNGMYRVGRLTKILEQLDEIYIPGDDPGSVFISAELPGFENGVPSTAWMGRTASHTLGNRVPGHKYFVEAQVTMTAHRTNDRRKRQDEVQVEERQLLPALRD